jgi:SAM-dependent methyltransferase
LSNSNLQYKNLDHTLRRYYIDEFYNRHVSSISDGSLVLDLGGNKVRKRGLFNTDRLNLRVIYANLSNEKEPDVQADAMKLPFRENVFDAVICSELLEHIYSPECVLREVIRVMKPHGILLVTVPFFVPYHADPYDFGRYTKTFWNHVFNDVGFRRVQIESQGYFWSVLLDMVRGYVTQRQDKQGNCMWAIFIYFLKHAIILGRMKVIPKETFPMSPAQVFFQNYTTGFGITAIKQ